ncbi:MAG TPA: GNAT family N-acetyltransferase [Jatrophihabitans sp.]|nr:GNAT family N-acetyltransferase [Jatrophihabitans sp.]
MTRRVASLTLENLGELPARCRECVFWELDPAAGQRAIENGDTALEKEAWLSDTLLQWGSCGHLAYVDGAPAGYVIYAPPAYVPRSAGFATSPVSPDAVLLITARLAPGFAGNGLGRVLVQAAVRDVVRRGIRALEAFGRDGDETVASEDPAYRCLLPAGYLRAIGFKTVRAHPHTPRLRLDARTTVTWREDVEYALERLLGTIPAPALSR